MKLRLQLQSGMTLIEALVVVGLYTVLMFAVLGSIAELYRINAYSLAQADEVDNARRGIIQLNRDAKELVTAEDGTWPVLVIEPHRFGYFSDTDVDQSVEYVEYSLSSTTITKYTHDATGNPPTYNFSTPDKTEILSEYVQNLNQGTSTFLYYDTNGVELSSTSPVIDVRYIKAQIIVNIDANRQPGEFLLRTGIAPRNLKDNL